MPIATTQTAEDSEPVRYNSRLVDLFLQQVKAEYPRIEVDQLLNEVNIRPASVTDPGFWFEQGQVDALVERLVGLTGNNNLAREVGRFTASSRVLGAFRQHVLGLIAPAKALGLIHKSVRNFTRSIDYHVQSGDNRVEVSVAPKCAEKAHHCAFRRGFLEELTGLLNVDDAGLDHPECLHHGGAACRYVISWRPLRSAPWAKARACAVPAWIVFALASAILLPGSMLSWLVAGSATLLFGFSLWVCRLEKRDFLAGVERLQQSTESLAEELNTSYSNAQLAAEIGQAISARADIEGILVSVTRVLQERLDFDRGAILLLGENRDALNLKAAFGYSEPLPELAEHFWFRLDPSAPDSLFQRAMNEQQPLLIDDVATVEEQLSSADLQLARQAGVHSFICCPITYEAKAIGVMLVDNKRTQRPLLKSDLTLLMGIVPAVGIRLHNARLMQQRSEQFNSILQVLSASIDARDFLTAGHSEKVTSYSVGICRELGIPTEETEVIRVAAMLHDYGKIGVPDFILKKEGQLSEQERALVETHPGRTREILERASFEGRYRQVPQIAGLHHEKFDGSGYPYGLKGEEIPLGARIIAVADFFEAITAKRHYRGPMSMAKALDLLREKSGTHFDGRVVAALINHVMGSTDLVAEQKEEGIKFFHRHVRVPCRCQVSCKAGKTTISGSSVNLSAGGMFVATEELLDVETAVDLVFTLPTFPEQLVSCRGRVAWINPENKISPLPVGFGVQFFDLPAEESGEVKELVSKIFAGE